MIKNLLLIAFLSLSLAATSQHGSDLSSATDSHVRKQRPVRSAVCKAEFELIKSEMNRNRGQSAKRDVALAAVQDYFFNSGQIAVLMRKLTWDDDRYKLAKTAYGKTLDRKNYSQLSCLFSNSAWGRKLNKYTADHDYTRRAMRKIRNKRNVLEPICPVGLQDIKSDMDRQRGQSAKRDALLYAVDSNYFTSGQVAKLIRKLTWESDRLKVAKAAYLKTLDQENYACVGAGLGFSSYEKILAKYMDWCLSV